MAEKISWVRGYELENQCNMCRETLEEDRFVACMFGQKEFPRATHCPKFKYMTEDSE